MSSDSSGRIPEIQSPPSGPPARDVDRIRPPRASPPAEERTKADVVTRADQVGIGPVLARSAESSASMLFGTSLCASFEVATAPAIVSTL